MIFTCDNCSAALQIDEGKAPVGKFTIRCPKCKNLVRVQIRGEAKTTTAPEPQPAQKSRESGSLAAPSFASEAPEAELQQAPDPNDFLRALASLLQPNANVSTAFPGGKKPGTKRVLLCLPDKLRDISARTLTEAGYEVFSSDAPQQALETMREANLQLLILSPDFCSHQKGAFVLQKHFNSLTGMERRRFFLASLEDAVHTYDSHEAFLRNLNLVVHVNDARNLPAILKRALRDHEELYHHFKEASTV